MSDDLFEDIKLEPSPECVALSDLFRWLTDDYGADMSDLVIMDLMTLARAQPEMPLLDVIQHIALDWSK